MNRVEIIGRIVRDIKTESSTNGTTYLRNAVAVDRRGKEKETDFFEITAFGKTAEFIESYFAKGRKIAISGHLQSNSYKDKEGKSHTSVAIICDEVDFCDSKAETTKSEGFLDVNVTEELPFE
jgi:single-strand DNA-binding protein